ncbi:nitrite reductase [Gallibacterium genomosp. 1]|uniref:Nitrite reductase n=1 Tax=Gallibacterium genomosp. 1 TaxID=155515 RepID=A0AB36DY23_9PAST|nr:nitrite reductase [Gallibacterium genomosp. 1]OBX02497.1 nitrite reductase [Gallibacterium genomosp. 1]OBX03658.1 nitrite reductase [Gallibacterium genomosp. 1]
MANLVFFAGVVVYLLILVVIFYLHSPTESEDRHNQKLNNQLLQQQLQQYKFKENEALANEIIYRFMQDQKDEEIANSMADYSKKIACGIGVIILVVMVGYYLYSGRLQTLNQQQNTQQTENRETTTVSLNEDNIIAIQNKIRTDPNNGENWYELGLAYAQNNEFSNAIESYSRATVLLGRKPYILGAAATALYYKDQQHISSQAQQWLDEALQLDAEDTASLLLLANDAFRQAHYDLAINYWQKVLDSHRKVDRKLLINLIQIAQEKQKLIKK